jgi:hypothetical protein
MSEDRNFVARWSRLKRETKKHEDAPQRAADASREAAEPGAGDRHPASGQSAGKPEDAFDISSLPPIESIAAETDIRDFLRAGVPAELTKAALRRAWSADPAIRDFIGIAENQWDFTDPTAIPGFGPLQPGDNVVAQAIGSLKDNLARPAAGAHTAAGPDEALPTSVRVGEAQPPAAEPVHSEVANPADESSGEDSDSVREDGAAAPQHASHRVALKPRKHGGALPKRT